MTVRRLLAALLAALVVSTQSHAKIEQVPFPSRPGNGAKALETMHEREVVVVETLACKDEIRFVENILGDGVRFGSWPTDQLFAKAAFISDRPFHTSSDGAYCFIKNFDVGEWNGVLGQIFPGENLVANAATLNRAYEWLFGPSCKDRFRLDDVAHPNPVADTASSTSFNMTPECLVAQIGSVLRQPRLGQWEWDKKDNKLLYKNPGTDGLPCISSFRFKGEDGIKGDWDMSVVAYTRMSYFLHEALDINWQWALVPLSRNDLPVPPGTPAFAPPKQLPTGYTFQDAMRKLDQFLLTLRGAPNDGTYNLVLTCGNPDNSYGSATDYIKGNDVYDEAEGQRPSSTGSDFAKWLLALLILLILLALAAAAAAAAAALAGAAAAAAAAAAAILVAAAAIVATVFISPGLEETENHLLMMNSSNYLKNKLMLVELNNSGDKEGFKKLEDENEEVRDWLLERFEDIAEDDFVEYNSRPYGHWSMTGLLNLHDFPCEVSTFPIVMVYPMRGTAACDDGDKTLVTAVDAVLDLHSAKAALGSLEAMRIVPFRRKAVENNRFATGRSLMEVGGGADHMIGALQFWTGVTEHGPKGEAHHASLGAMLWHATSGYRPPEMILDIALDKSTPYEQTITHGGYERYVSGPGWLITSGGDDTRPAQGFVWVFGATTYNIKVPDDDHGVGVPTTFMSRRGPAHDKYTDFVRFDGVHKNWDDDDDGNKLISFSNNRCVTENFACGDRLQLPPAVRACVNETAASRRRPGLLFIDSEVCNEYHDGGSLPSDHFYLAIFDSSCGATPESCRGGEWGFFEVAPRSSFASVDAYADAVIRANLNHIGKWGTAKADDEIKFVQVTQGNRTLEFEPEDEDFGADCRACGAIINRDDDARFSIRHPRRGGRILVDLDDEDDPVRHGEGGISLCAPPPPPGQPWIGEYCFDRP